MENKVWHYMDEKKAKWGAGEWQQEPDKMQWADEATKLPCLIVRNQLGALCGYVGVFKGHPYFEKEYRDINCEVHGGLTFSDFCEPHPENKEHGICHIVSEGEDDHVWWLGFDCAHADDIVPSYFEAKKSIPALTFFMGEYGEAYKNIDYVKNECRELAEQLVSIK